MGALLKDASVLKIRNLNVWYGNRQILRDSSFDVKSQQVTALIGPSNSGKSTLVRCLNRLNDFTSNFKLTGEILFKDQNLYASSLDATQIRRQIGMVFDKPIPFRQSIYQNVAYGPRISSITQSGELDAIVEKSLRAAALWDEVSCILDKTPALLTIGQQQRLCIARALASNPEVLIFDEPCRELDPMETAKVEALIRNLKKQYTLIFVTSKRRQAARVSDFAGLLYAGELIEFDATKKIFTNPRDERTEQYVTGRLG